MRMRNWMAEALVEEGVHTSASRQKFLPVTALRLFT